MKGKIHCVSKEKAFEMARQFFGCDDFIYHEESELFDNYTFTYDDDDDVAELIIEKFYNTKWSSCPFGRFFVNDAAASFVEFVDGKPSKHYKQ